MSLPMPAASPRLPIIDTVRNMFLFLWEQRDELLRLGAVPFLAVLFLGILGLQISDFGLQVAMLLLQIVPLTVFSVSWHRLVLLGPMAVPGIGLEWRRRHFSYLWATLRISFALIPVMILVFASFLFAIGIGMERPIGAPPSIETLFAPDLWTFVLWLIPLALIQRLSLVMSASAIDRPMRLRQSWEATRRCTLALLAIGLLAWIPIALIQGALVWLATSTGFASAAPYSLYLLTMVASCMFTAVNVTMLSLVYRALVGVDSSRSA